MKKIKSWTIGLYAIALIPSGAITFIMLVAGIGDFVRMSVWYWIPPIIMFIAFGKWIKDREEATRDNKS